MHLRLVDGSGPARLGDDLSATNLVVFLDKKLIGMSVGRHPAIGVPDENEIAVALQLVARVGDLASFSSANLRALRHRDVHAVIVRAVRPPAIPRQNSA